VNRLRFPLVSLTPKGIAVDVTLSEAEIRPEGVEALPVDSVRVHGTLSQIGGEYAFRGTVAGRYKYPCDRCLEPAVFSFCAEALWVFSPGAAARDDGQTDDDADEEVLTVAIEGNEIDLAPQVWEEVVLAAPSKFLCREDCAGLCPQCGANLNRDRCSCRTDDSIENKGLAGLAALFPEIRPENSEDDPRASSKT
jgi:uncharacterized metal-binding protein YceD (DUF177 family)